jgi:uncharacterized protein YehS (DUF1456 family)
MKNNTALPRIQAALALTDLDIARAFGLGGYSITPEMLVGYRIEDPLEPGYIKCPNRALIAFLDGLIVDRRGPNPNKPKPGAVVDTTIDNSDIFKKLRIALDLHEEDIQLLLQKSNVVLEKNDFSAIFRKKGHKHYKTASDPVLEAFLAGVAESMGG